MLGRMKYLEVNLGSTMISKAWRNPWVPSLKVSNWTIEAMKICLGQHSHKANLGWFKVDCDQQKKYFAFWKGER